MLNLGNGNSVGRREALVEAYNLLRSAEGSVNNTYTNIDEKSTIVDYKVKLAYAWMDLASKIQ